MMEGRSAAEIPRMSGLQTTITSPRKLTVGVSRSMGTLPKAPSIIVKSGAGSPATPLPSQAPSLTILKGSAASHSVGAPPPQVSRELGAPRRSLSGSSEAVTLQLAAHQRKSAGPPSVAGSPPVPSQAISRHLVGRKAPMGEQRVSPRGSGAGSRVARMVSDSAMATTAAIPSHASSSTNVPLEIQVDHLRRDLEKVSEALRGAVTKVYNDLDEISSSLYAKIATAHQELSEESGATCARILADTQALEQCVKAEVDTAVARLGSMAREAAEGGAAPAVAATEAPAAAPELRDEVDSLKRELGEVATAVATQESGVRDVRREVNRLASLLAETLTTKAQEICSLDSPPDHCIGAQVVREERLVERKLLGEVREELGAQAAQRRAVTEDMFLQEARVAAEEASAAAAIAEEAGARAAVNAEAAAADAAAEVTGPFRREFLDALQMVRRQLRESVLDQALTETELVRRQLREAIRDAETVALTRSEAHTEEVRQGLQLDFHSQVASLRRELRASQGGGSRGSSKGPPSGHEEHLLLSPAPVRAAGVFAAHDPSANSSRTASRASSEGALSSRQSSAAAVSDHSGKSGHTDRTVCLGEEGSSSDLAAVRRRAWGPAGVPPSASSCGAAGSVLHHHPGTPPVSLAEMLSATPGHELPVWPRPLQPEEGEETSADTTSAPMH
eukprot:gnl/TRDRNA2_/TRDRNA2_171576_c2_seq4.p1 gnl/TRDRNA2_/TRDRNA2_171576_c2~~gnl/TRDRNA2_/TRDRNA2_171576_c2_seq4.p1  ORF type:complete len:677 (-),score=123.07 gnl/TRDRNA2_/TRDRNA2_171576_c2_seq4:105-2135(-)